MTPHRRPLLLVSLVAAVAAGGFAFTYWVLTQQAGRSLRPGLPEQAPAAPPPALRQLDSANRNPKPAPRTTPETLVVRRTYYADCGDEVETRQKAGPRLAGKVAEELAQGDPRVEVEAFSAEEVDLLTTVQGSCPQHSAQRYLALFEGHVAEFQGPPGGRGSRMVKTFFDVAVGSLPDREVEDLRRGILITSDEQLNRVLQSYMDLAGY